MTDWFTADLHLGHETVAKKRGFPSSDVHDVRLLAMINRTVQRGDRLFVLGDVTSGHDEKDEEEKRLETLYYSRCLPSEIHLILGNHERIHPHRSGFFKSNSAYTDWFDSVHESGTLKIAGQRAVLSHYPYDGDHKDEDRDVQWRLRDIGAPIIHGHTHSSTKVSRSQLGSLQICVSLEAWDFELVSKDTISDLVRKFDQPKA